MLFRQNGRSLTVHTPAKLNLFLEVLGKRSDGFHELETVMVSVRLYDTLCFTDDPSKSIRFEGITATAPEQGNQCSDSLPGGKDNLIVRAAELLRSHAGIERGVRIHLLKRIPISAGLAGGSSDAAATLAALNRLWDLKLSVGELQNLAAQLGSDVSFFLEPSPVAVCRGRGELIEPLSVPVSLHFVIVRPQNGLSTADVFRSSQPVGNPKNIQSIVGCLKSGQLVGMADRLHNSLQPAAEKLNPEVTQLRKRFDGESVLGHLMSGSGSSYFGLCTTRRQAQRIAARFRNSQAGTVFVAQSGF